LLTVKFVLLKLLLEGLKELLATSTSTSTKTLLALAITRLAPIGHPQATIQPS